MSHRGTAAVHSDGHASGVNQITLDLEPGEYALLCFVPDAKDGSPT